MRYPGVSFQHQNHLDSNIRYCVNDIFVLDYGYIIDIRKLDSVTAYSMILKRV